MWLHDQWRAASPPGEDPEASAADSARRTVQLIFAAALTCRVAGGVSPLTRLLLGEPLDGAPTAVAATAALLLLNTVLAVRLTGRRPLHLFERPGVLVADTAIAIALNLWVGAQLPDRALVDPFRDLAWFYLAGTVPIVTIGAGSAAGAALSALAAPVQLGMLVLNAVPLEAVDWPRFAARLILVLQSYVVAGVVLAALRRAVRLERDAGRLIGTQTERSRLLRSLHDTVLQTLEAIALRADPEAGDAARRLEDIRRSARRQALHVRAALLHPPGAARSLAARLEELAEEFAGMGLELDLVLAAPDREPEPAARTALEEGTREAVANVWKHAGVERAVVRLAPAGDGVEVTVRDQGGGFDVALADQGFGIRQSIVQRLRDAGGSAEVWSRPGGGTRVRMWVPTC